MTRLFDVKGVDRRFYQEKLQSFLPQRIIDVHTHVWLQDFRRAPPTGRAVTWPLRVAAQDPVEDLIETYRLLFPGKSVQPLMFSFVESHEDDFEGANAYVSRAAPGEEHGLPSSLGEELGREVGYGEAAEAFARGARYALERLGLALRPGELTAAEQERAAALLDSKYSRDEWNLQH
jgi:hypothetical protein